MAENRISRRHRRTGEPMNSSRIIRTTAVLALAGLVVGMLAAAPAEAKKKKKKPAVCKAFTPGEAGTDQPTVVLTDAATEEAPAEQAVTIDPSAADADVVGSGAIPAPSTEFNVQVDSAAKEAGLYVNFEFDSRRDYDINLLNSDGSYAARSHGFQPVLGTPGEEQLGNETGVGGESTDHSEKLVGIRTNDCGGWTVQLQNWLGEGGDFTVQLWLGDIKTDPQAPGVETP